MPAPGEDAFRAEVRGWLDANLTGDFAQLRGSGGPGREHEFVPERMAWERRLGADGWIGLGWPEPDGGRGLSWRHQVIFSEEYARAGAPGRVGHIGEQLLGPTLLMFGTAQQRARFLPGVLHGTQLWCQGYSEPGAGSDLAAVSTRARLDGGEWHVDGQKVWTSLAEVADWCFVLARTDPAAERHRGLSYLLVPMRQPGIEVRPIMQLTGTSEFDEVFFDDARAAAADIVGAPGDGWRVAMGTLAVERGVSTFGQQLGFQREFEAVLASARSTGAVDVPALRARIVQAWIGLQVMRYTALATLRPPGHAMPANTVPANTVPANTVSGVEANVSKLIWSRWHQRLGELAIDVAGPAATLIGPGYDLSDAQRLFLFTRADTIYGGSDEIQRNVLAERGLRLPREPR